MSGPDPDRAPITVRLLRHGQSDWNLAGLIQGQRDEPTLTELGRAQARAAAARLAELRITAVLSSDLARARQTATIVSDVLGVATRTDLRLREQGLGTAEGQHRDAVLCAFADHPWTDVDARLPRGESLRDVYERLGGVLRECRAETFGDQPVWVTHGDTARVARCLLRGDPIEEVSWSGPANGEIWTVSLPSG